MKHEALRDRLYKSNLRRVAKMRQRIRIKITKRFVRNLPREDMKNLRVYDKNHEYTVGKIVKVYRKRPKYADVLMEFLTHKDAFNYQRGSRYFNLEIDDCFFYHDDVESFRSKVLKRKYKTFLREQAKTRKLRKAGLIGREYNEKW